MIKRSLLIILIFLNYFIDDIKAQSCDSIVPSFNVDLSLNPDSVWESPLVQRNGYCCGASEPDRCIEFKVKIHSSAWGVVVGHYGALSGVTYIRRECGKFYPMSSGIAVAPGKGSSITFCKPGTNTNIYYIKTVRCDSTLTVPLADFSIIANENEIQFNDISEYSAARTWDFGDGFIDSIANPLHVYQDIGTYTVKMIAYNGCGTDTVSKYINITSIASGITENAARSLSIYPNPASNYINIDLNKNFNNNSKIMIYDFTGRAVKSVSLENTDKNVRINVADWSSGLYLYRLIENGIITHTGKIAIRNYNR